MFNSVLICNRGEIACRIIRTAQNLGMRTVAVFSSADANALHVKLADQAVYLGEASPNESYLNIPKILRAAREEKVDCIHPGYGFLSENAEFAEECRAAGVTFVGPPAESIRAMGLKDGAKAIMEKAGVPVVPGYHGDKQLATFLKEKAYEIGYPVLIKAVAGGGGKGMRLVEKHGQFEEALSSAKREAKNAFGDDRVLIEKYVASPRHIEMQIFADRFGNVVHLFERDCSLQRRHQKVIEEAPAPGMPENVREAMGNAAIAAAKATGYQGAGTVEFIADGSEELRADGFWFMEMNTRLQVEHPVTEAITGLDLVEMQFLVAAGEQLPVSQDQISINGHAVEARIYAENPRNKFLPSTGTLDGLELFTSGKVRVDTGVIEGDNISPHYDPMIAKIIAHGKNREKALDRLTKALRRSVVAGPKTNLHFLAKLSSHPAFLAQKFNTGFIDTHLEDLIHIDEAEYQAMAALGAIRLIERENETNEKPGTQNTLSPWDIKDGFQLLGTRTVGLDILVDGEPLSFEYEWEDGEPSICIPEDCANEQLDWPEMDAVTVDVQSGIYVINGGYQVFVSKPDYDNIEIEDNQSGSTIKAPMHGKVMLVDAVVGAIVKKGDRLAVLEAMKMEHSITAFRDGEIEEILMAPGQQISENDPVIVLKAENEDDHQQ